MQVFTIKDEYIKLGQALKAVGFADTGLDAKIAIQEGKVKVNDIVCLQRGKKLIPGDLVEYMGRTFKIE